MKNLEKKKKIDWKKTIKNNGYMLGFITKVCPGVLIIGIIVTIFNAVNSFLLNTYLYQYTLNALQEGKALKSIIINLVFLFVFSISYQFFRNIYNYYRTLKSPKIEAYIQKKLQKKAAEVELACFENASFYDTYVKATAEATNRAFDVMDTMFDIIWMIIMIIATGTLIFTIDPIFLIFAFIPLICTIIIGKKRNRIQYDYHMKTQEMARQRDYVRRTFYLNEFSKEMRLTQMWKVMFKRMHSSIAEMKKIVDQYGYKLMFFAYLFDFIFDIVVDMGSTILAAYKTLVAKNMLLGDCFVVINSLAYLSYCVNDLGTTTFKLDEHSLYIDNLRNFLEYKVEIPEIETAPVVPHFQTLELCNIRFRYSEKNDDTLKHVSFNVKAGEKIAIVGHNGAGKTTLIKLILRLYDPTEGEILLNGKNIKNYRLSSYRNLFGTVFQDYQLFAASIAENVMLRGNITEKDREIVKDSLAKAGMSPKISNLANGIDSVVTKEFDDKGVMFSGGEAQKISIARIFAGNSEIVIMDEPTSALDPIAEQEMYSNMFEACKGKTVIFISHRLSSAAMADMVYLFENGEIVEQGTHHELLARNQKYANMWHKQADTYIDKEDITA